MNTGSPLAKVFITIIICHEHNSNLRLSVIFDWKICPSVFLARLWIPSTKYMDGEFLLPFPSHSHSSLIICALIRNAITVGIFYGLPALQFVLGQQLVSP